MAHIDDVFVVEHAYDFDNVVEAVSWYGLSLNNNKVMINIRLVLAYIYDTQINRDIYVGWCD